MDLSKHLKMSEFIKKFEDGNLEYCNNNLDDINFDWISMFRDLSEKFIEKYSDKINWNNVSYCQEISKEFISNHFDKLTYEYLLRNKSILPEVKDKLKKLYGFI